MAAGIDIRHTSKCAAREGGACSCKPSFQAHVWDSRSGKRIRRTFSDVVGGKALARRGDRRARAGHAARVRRPHGARGRRGVVRRRSGGRDPQPLGGRIQAVRSQGLPAELPAPRRARARVIEVHRCASGRPAGPRRPPRRPGPGGEHRAMRDPAAARDVPAGAVARRRGDQPDDRPRAARDPRRPRPRRVTGGGPQAARGGPGVRPRALGDRDVCGPAPRRADGAAMGRREP